MAEDTKQKKKTKTMTDETCLRWRTDEYRAKRRLLQSNPRAKGPRGEYGNYADKIDAAATAKFIPKLQKYLMQQPGGRALANKVAGWGAYQDGGGTTCYVDLVANNCYRSKPKVEAALAAEVSA